VIRHSEVAADRGDTAEIGDGSFQRSVRREASLPESPRAFEEMAGELLAEIGPLGPWHCPRIHDPPDVLVEPPLIL